MEKVLAFICVIRIYLMYFCIHIMRVFKMNNVVSPSRGT